MHQPALYAGRGDITAGNLDQFLIIPDDLHTYKNTGNTLQVHLCLNTNICYTVL